MPKVLIGNTDSSNEPERPKKTFISNIHGDDAYELAVENGFEGDMQAWLASLEGEVGFTPFFVVTDTHIQVGYQRGTEVIAPVDLVSLDTLRPEAGTARWDTILEKPDKFPPADHKHPASDIEGLVGDISKAEAEEMDEEILRLAKEHADALTVDWDSLSGKPLSFIPAAHTHAISGVDGLDVALGNKSNVGHTHPASDISDLPAPGTSKEYVDTELAKKANISHTHQASDISGLPAAPDVSKSYVDTELAKKSNTTHTHTFDSIADRPLSYPPGTHQHSASDVNSGVFSVDRLGTGSTGSDKILFGDGVWKNVPTGGPTPYELIGPGRPDIPSGTGLSSEIAAAPVGTTYLSTDGSGTGAWGWRKRSTGWVVVDGDTGVRRFVISNSAFPSNGSYVEYRRRQDTVFLQVNSTNAGAWRLNALAIGSTVPVLNAQPGFRPSSSAMAELNNDGRGRLGAYLLQMPPNDGAGALQIRAFEAVAANGWVRVPILTWLTPDDWPATLPGSPVT